MVTLTELLKDFEGLIPIVKTIILVLILFVVFSLVIKILSGFLLKKAKSKKQKSNVKIFSRVLIYSFLVVLIIFAISSYASSWAGLGLGIGLFSAALGWALQKPITGIAAWIMIVAKRPFDIGDRIIIGTVRGDVTDISLTHIYLHEIGGIVGGEENSGRIIMVPNSILFEQNIINYTSKDEYTLDQVAFQITYESDLDEAIKIAVDSAKKELKDKLGKIPREPYSRTYFQASGMEVRVRYFAPATRLQEFSSNISQEVFRRIRQAKNVEIAYPHNEVLFRKKDK